MCEQIIWCQHENKPFIKHKAKSIVTTRIPFRLCWVFAESKQTAQHQTLRLMQLKLHAHQTVAKNQHSPPNRYSEPIGSHERSTKRAHLTKENDFLIY